jgi:1A family penicillin-binding protein
LHFSILSFLGRKQKPGNIDYTMKKHKHLLLNILLICVGVGIVGTGVAIIWVSTLKIPDFQSFDDRVISSSTKIYDRTGEIVLYDIHQDKKRTVIPFEEMGDAIKNATVSIEDETFYTNNGINIKSIIRAILVDLKTGSYSQGASTITQQVVKNSLLTIDKSPTRKLKEIFLALKISKSVSKEDILETYLNEAPYGGSLYGISEASMTFFGKKPADLSIAEAAYLASIPQAPSRYSPYGPNTDKLEARKNLVLSKMLELGFITQEEYDSAKAEVVNFIPQDKLGIKAPHFVFYVKDYLEEKYGVDAVESGGLKVITTLDYDLQEKAEEIVLKNALQNEKDWDASNAGLVAIDPKTGQILTMVGSRDYFDKNIDGKFNIALAKRQPGSSFKPFIYATAFSKGFTPNTVLFDVPTEFQSTCDPYGKAITGSQSNCYSPKDYDNVALGPLSLRNALAQSRNIPSVQLLYLTTIADSLKTAKNMGITTLGSANDYGLTLVLGGGEVSLLDMTSAYGVFAAEGIRYEPQAILHIEDADGNVLEDFQKKGGQRVLDENSAREISDILSDNVARTPYVGANSFMYFGDIDVAGKTGTTDNNKDAWMMGYTPDIAVGVWSGNNDNTAMKKGSAISGHLWRDFMDVALKEIPHDSFTPPQINDSPDLKPVLRGIWQGGDSVFIDTVSGKLATDLTPEETKKELVPGNVHSILYWVDRNDILGPPPGPQSNQQYINWETSVQNWWQNNKSKYNLINSGSIPTEYDDIHTEENQPKIEINSPNESDIYDAGEPININISYNTKFPVKSFDIFLNNVFIGTRSSLPFQFSFIPKDIENIQENNELKVIVRDNIYNSAEATVNFKLDI